MATLNGTGRVYTTNTPASGVWVSGLPPVTNQRQEHVQRFVANLESLLFSRTQLAKALMDPRRDVESECGYPREVTSPEIYRALYDRSPIANRAASVWSAECFQVPFRVYEDEDEGDVTEFEKAVDELNRSLRGGKSWHTDTDLSSVNDLLRRADILSGLGGYGVVFLALDDGLPLNMPAQGFEEEGSLPYGFDYQFGTDGRPTKNSAGELVTNAVKPPAHDPRNPPSYKLTTNRERKKDKGLKLNFARVLDESLALVTRWEGNPNSPRFGMPNQYLLTFADPRERSTLSGIGLSVISTNVHWSRVVHLADTHHSASSGVAYAVPRLKVVLDTLLGLRKVYGAAPESYWKNSLMRLFFGGDNPDMDVDRQSFKDVMEDMENSLQRYALAPGLNVQTVSPQVVDPTGFVAVLVEAVCIFLKCPVRVFKGSERGELASTQDDEAWNDRLKERQANYLTPGVVAPFFDRLIELGVLPEPKEYFIEWPDLTSQSDDQKAQLALKKVQCLAQYIQGGLDVLMAPMDFLTRVMEFDEEAAESIIENALAYQESDDGANFLGRNSMFAVRSLLQLYQSGSAGQMTEMQVRAIMGTVLHFSDAEIDQLLAGGLQKVEPPAIPGAAGGKPPAIGGGGFGGGGGGGGGMGGSLGGLRLNQTANSEWREDLHPRADDGKFGEGAGSGKADEPKAATDQAGAAHPMAGMTRAQQVKALADATGKLFNDQDRDPFKTNTGPPPGLDMKAFASDLEGLVAQHAQERGSTGTGDTMEKFYPPLAEKYGLSKHDFLKAVTQVHKDGGSVRLGGWGRMTHEVPDPQLMTSIGSKTMAYLHPPASADAASLARMAQQWEPGKAAPKAEKPPEPGFTGKDALGRQWQNGKLVAKAEEPKAAPRAPKAGKMTVDQAHETIQSLMGQPHTPESVSKLLGVALSLTKKDLVALRDRLGVSAAASGTKAQLAQKIVAQAGQPKGEPAPKAAAPGKPTPESVRAHLAGMTTHTPEAVKQAGEMLMGLKAPDLKALAKERGVAVSGAKAALRDRILAKAAATPAAAPPAVAQQVKDVFSRAGTAAATSADIDRAVAGLSSLSGAQVQALAREMGSTQTGQKSKGEWVETVGKMLRSQHEIGGRTAIADGGAKPEPKAAPAARLQAISADIRGHSTDDIKAAVSDLAKQPEAAVRAAMKAVTGVDAPKSMGKAAMVDAVRDHLTSRKLSAEQSGFDFRPKPEEPKAVPPGKTPNEERVADSLVSAHRAIKESGHTGGVVKIPDLYDAVKKDHPQVTQEQFHDLLRKWHSEDKVNLQTADALSLEPRGKEAMPAKKGDDVSKQGHGLFYVQLAGKEFEDRKTGGK